MSERPIDPARLNKFGEIVSEVVAESRTLEHKGDWLVQLSQRLARSADDETVRWIASYCHGLGEHRLPSGLASLAVGGFTLMAIGYRIAQMERNANEATTS